MRRLPLLALAAALTLTACGDSDDPVVVDSDTVTVEVDPAEGLVADTTMVDDIDGTDAPPADAMDADVAPPPPPAPAPTGPDEAALDADAAAMATADAKPAATGLSTVTFFNNTGMPISHLYIAGCDESEGSDWNDMKSWAQERLEGDALDPDESTTIQYADGCYVAEPHYVGGTPISEKVIVEGDTRVDFTIG